MLEVRSPKEREKVIRSYKDLEVYNKSYEAALEMHKRTLKYPEYERYELGSQIRRATMSIPLNIAEGYGRKESAASFKNFLRNALGSANEVKVLLEAVKDLEYMEEKEYEEMYERYDQIGRQLYRLIENWK